MHRGQGPLLDHGLHSGRRLGAGRQGARRHPRGQPAPRSVGVGPEPRREAGGPRPSLGQERATHDDGDPGRAPPQEVQVARGLAQIEALEEVVGVEEVGGGFFYWDSP